MYIDFRWEISIHMCTNASCKFATCNAQIILLTSILSITLLITMELNLLHQQYNSHYY